jgi:hypothetical protein
MCTWRPLVVQGEGRPHHGAGECPLRPGEHTIAGALPLEHCAYHT